MLFTDNVIPALDGYRRSGNQIALVTLVNVDGNSPRPIGSQIGVATGGQYTGMITGGCAEKAIVAEAQKCLDSGRNSIVRYGAGSPYLDVVLPCGSGIDLHFEVQSADTIVDTVLEYHAMRRSVTQVISLESLSSIAAPEGVQNQGSSRFTKHHYPDYRLHVFGEGTNLVTFCLIGKLSGYDITAYSPDEDAILLLESNGITTCPIHREYDFSSIGFDPWSAIITLFHEHDWEVNILTAALASAADYIGALGSKTTHANRLEALSRMDTGARPVTDIHGPIGLNINAQNPSEIAISILAEITSLRSR